MTPSFTTYRSAAAVAPLCFASTAQVGQQRVSLIDVAPPAGNVQTDRASIIAAVERALPGNTIQFAVW